MTSLVTSYELDKIQISEDVEISFDYYDPCVQCIK